jgi:hypothetical protein
VQQEVDEPEGGARNSAHNGTELGTVVAGASAALGSSLARQRSDEGEDTGRSLTDAIEDSITSMRDNFVERHHSEPEVNLRLSSRGVDSSTITMPVIATARSTSPPPSNDSLLLPGPRQVVTDPGSSGINPVTGLRQRRRGVSGPPTGMNAVKA